MFIIPLSGRKNHWFCKITLSIHETN